MRPIVSNNSFYSLDKDNSPPYVDLGCGEFKCIGHFGIDIHPGGNVDLVWDLEDGIPLIDDSVMHIQAKDILEHLSDPIFILKEIWRVCHAEAAVTILVPDSGSRAAFQDPRHRTFWNINSFGYWVSDHELADNIRGICLFRYLSEPLIWETDKERDIKHVNVVLAPVKKEDWLRIYSQRHPEEFFK